MGTYTTNYNLFLPSIGEQGWGTLVNGNFTTIDTTMKGLDTRIGTLETKTGAIEGRLTTSEERITTLEGGEFNKIKIPFNTDTGLLKVINISEITQPFNFSLSSWSTKTFGIPSFGINNFATIIPSNPEDVVANVKVSVGQTNMVKYTLTIIDNVGNTVISKTGETSNSALSFNETVPLMVNGKGMSYTGTLTLTATHSSQMEKSYSASVTAQYSI